MNQNLEKKDRILVICAHPDDEIIGCGGTIAKYSQSGHEIYTIIFSYGEGSHPWLKETNVINTRIKESHSAGKVVGTKETFFIGVADGSFSLDIEKRPIIIDTLKDLIIKINPNKIFTHSFDDVMYYDHRSTYDTVIKVLKRINFKGEVYTFNIWNPINLRKRNLPKLVIDITDTFSKKIKALGMFKSQKVALIQLTPVVYIRAFFHGLTKGFKFAEIFYKIK